MSTYNIQPLESFRLGAYQLPLPCYLCDSGNLFDADTCRTCGAPMEMMRVAAGSKTKARPQVIPTLGAGDVGKTVYLGMLLDILARQNEELQFMTCDAASVTLQQESISVLARGEFPPSTSTNPESWRWAHCRLKRRTGTIAMESFLLDMSGLSLMEELERPGTIPVVGGMIRKATGVMLVVDVDRVQQGDRDEEFFALKILGHFQQVIERQAQAQAQTAKETKRWAKSVAKNPATHVPPLAVVQMKADRCQACVDDPAEYARGQMPNLWRFCKDRFPNHCFFASSAVGASVEMPNGRGDIRQVPLRIEPRGIMQPFRWLFSQFTP